jgi:hypothetical protein
VSLALRAPAWSVIAFSGLTRLGLSMFAVLWTTALQRQVVGTHLGRVMAMDS